MTQYVNIPKAGLNAFEIVLPEAKIITCHFHYAQAIMRNVSKKGLGPVYELSTAGQNNFNQPIYRTVRDWLQRWMSMPLVPRDDVDPARTSLPA